MNKVVLPCGCRASMGHALKSIQVTKPCAYHLEQLKGDNKEAKAAIQQLLNEANRRGYEEGLTENPDIPPELLDSKVREARVDMSKELTLDIELTKEWLSIFIDGREVLQTPNTPKTIQKMKVELEREGRE